MAKKYCYGYMTLFLTLCLTCFISFCLILIKGVHNNSVKTETGIVAEIGMNSVLAEYHQELFEKYDVFFVDTSYGSKIPSPINTEKQLKKYLDKNFSKKDILFNFIYRDLLQIQVKKVQLQNLCVATDEGGIVFRRQATDYMYDKIGLDILEEVAGWIGVVNQYTVKFYELPELRNRVIKQFEELQPDKEFFKNNSWTEEVYQNIVSQRDIGWLDLCLLMFSGKIDGISKNKVDLSQYVSSREVNQGSGINPNITYKEGVTENLLFQEYLMEKTGDYSNPAELSPLQYETEYIIGGKASDIENLAIVISELLLIRQASNITYLLTDMEKMKIIEEISCLIAALLEAPGTEYLFEAMIIFSWSYAESIYDVRTLLHGGEVPLMKVAQQWFLDWDFFLSLGGNYLEKESEYGDGLSYDEYLRIILFFQNTDLKTKRFMDLVEMNIRQTVGNSNFRIDGCVDGFSFLIEIKEKNGQSYSIQRWCGYY